MIKSIFGGWSVWAYVALALALSATIGGYGYHRGALSQAKLVGELNGTIDKLKSDVTAAEAETTACNDDIRKANETLKLVQEEAQQRMRAAASAANKARIEAKKYERALAAIVAEGPSSSCDEEAERFRADLRKERAK